MTKQLSQLAVDRCPHCNVAKPRIDLLRSFETVNFAGGNKRFWAIYCCRTCGGVILTWSHSGKQGEIAGFYPNLTTVNEVVPSRAREYLMQAIDSLNSPAGSVLLSASAVDSMLKEKGYKDGNLFPRIDKAKEDHLITEEMAAWAHEIRLDANDQRHADDNAPLPSEADARKSIEFALALAELLFVLPARVERGRE